MTCNRTCPFGRSFNIDGNFLNRIVLYLGHLFLTTFLLSFAYGQRTLTLDDAVSLAQTQSPFYHSAKNTFERSYWQFRNFKAKFKPHVRLRATVPTFYRAINPITQPDGSIRFVRVSQANNSLGVSISQNIGFTGGTLRAGSSLQRTDNFSGSESSYFLSTPVQLTYTQNSLLYNDFYWQKKLEPMLFETAEKRYSEDIEAATFVAASLFLEGVQAQVAIDISITNQANADTLYKLSKERFAIGTVPISDLLQLELNVLKANSELSDLLLTREGIFRKLKRILGLDVDEEIRLSIPPTPSRIIVPFDKAIDHARLNRPAILKFRTDRLAADQEIAKAKGQNSLEVSLLANLGTQQTATKFADAYGNLQNQQYIGLSLDVPIEDWGFRKSQIRLAKANRELLEVSLKQEELAFEQEVYMQVLQFNQNYERLQITQMADSIAQERLKITKDRYLLGKISIPDLTLALQESVSRRQGYIQSLTSYWLSFHTLRRLTLFDFIKNETLTYRKQE